MSLDPSGLPGEVQAFLSERHLATLTTLRPDGTPHVVAVGFTWDAGERAVRVMTSGRSRKARNVGEGAGHPVRGRAVVCQLDGPRWLALEGTARLTSDPAVVADAVQRYARRYRQPGPNPERVIIVIDVDLVLGRG